MKRICLMDLLRVTDVLEITGKPEEYSKLVEVVGKLVKEPRFPRELLRPRPTS